MGTEDSQAVRAGERESFRETYLEYFPRSKSYFRSRRFSWEDAEDLTQKTLLNVYNVWERYAEQPDLLAARIYATGRNAARDEWRRKGRAQITSLPEQTPSLGQPLEDAASGRETLSRAAAAVMELPARMRACLLLRVQHGLSYGEIAQRLCLSSNTVKVQIWKARRRLNQTGGRLGAPGEQT